MLKRKFMFFSSLIFLFVVVSFFLFQFNSSLYCKDCLPIGSTCDWDEDCCSDNCDWSSDIDLGGNNFYASGAGTITGFRYVSNYGTATIDTGCLAYT